MPTYIDGVSMKNSETEEERQRRLFDAELTTMSAMLNRWHNELGVEFLLIVRAQQPDGSHRVYNRWHAAPGIIRDLIRHVLEKLVELGD
jgi:hypothetical protein